MARPKHQKMQFNDSRYRYIRSKTTLFGYHLTPVNGKPGTIAVNKKLKGRIELDTNIHEMLHACGGFASEEWVNSTATQIAKALWQLGYRKNEGNKTPKKTRKQSGL